MADGPFMARWLQQPSTTAQQAEALPLLVTALESGRITKGVFA